jgi:protein gp37
LGKSTAIEWTDHTFNPWWGCMKVSPACDHCYAEAWDKRVGGNHWGPRAQRRTFGDEHWSEPLRWNRAAAAAGVRRRVFCASMADVFDNAAPAGALERLWQVILATPRLDWQLLTKRPQNIRSRLPADWGEGYPNVWLGTTVENQEEAERRIPHLLSVTALIRFLSCEPLLGPISLHKEWAHGGLHWIIAGGESGPKARPSNPEWFRSLRDQCGKAELAFHFKQWGNWSPQNDRDIPSKKQVQLYGESGIHVLVHIGKKASGRELDGRTWDGLPLKALQ